MLDMKKEAMKRLAQQEQERMGFHTPGSDAARTLVNTIHHLSGVRKLRFSKRYEQAEGKTQR